MDDETIEFRKNIIELKEKLAKKKESLKEAEEELKKKGDQLNFSYIAFDWSKVWPIKKAISKLEEDIYKFEHPKEEKVK